MTWHDKVTTPTHSSKFSDDMARLKDEIELEFTMSIITQQVP